MIICNRCLRAICVGPDAECLGLPVTSRYQDSDVLYLCPPCHQEGDRKARQPRPYYVRLTLSPQSSYTEPTTPIQGFYAFPELGEPPAEITAIQALKPAYGSPAIIRGSAQLMPRSKFLSSGIAVLSFRLESFHEDTGDLGKTLESFAKAFFPKENQGLLIFEHIVYDLEQSKLRHEQKVGEIAKKLVESRLVFRTMAGTYLI